MVAELTEGDKSGELLDVHCVIVGPYLMAAQPSILGSTDAAAVVITLVYLPANRIPLVGSKYLAHIVVPARLRYELDGKLEISQFLVSIEVPMSYCDRNSLTSGHNWKSSYRSLRLSRVVVDV